MSICFDAHRTSDDELVTRMVFDDPERNVLINFENNKIYLQSGFEYHSPGSLVVNSLSFLLWYRFTNRGMMIGYFANPGGTSFTIPHDTSLYVYSRAFNYNGYQPKIYLQCLDFDLYNDNNLAYEFDYYPASVKDTFSRIVKLDQLSAIQLKGFHQHSMSSFVLLPYTFIHTLKFDFLHTMFDNDGMFKENVYYHPTMFADGGELRPQFFPQPNTVDDKGIS